MNEAQARDTNPVLQGVFFALSLRDCVSISVQHGRRSETDVTGSQYSRPDCWKLCLSSTAEGMSWMGQDPHHSHPGCWIPRYLEVLLLNKHAVNYIYEVCV